MSQIRGTMAIVAVVAAAAVLSSTATAAAPPVGPLPTAQSSSVKTTVGQLVSVALPHRSGGRAWRIARAFNPKVVTEVTEGDVGSTVVLVFRAVAPGTTTLTFALTRGERPKAYEARTVTITVR